MQLEDLAWWQIKELSAKTDVIALPVATTEQHGPHLPVGTDTLLANEVAVRVGRKAGIGVAPALPYGVSPRHLAFPGSMTLSNETFLKVVGEVVLSLSAFGFHKVLVINGHGGNTHLLRALGYELAARNGILTVVADWWTLALELLSERWQKEDDPGGHGSVIETSAVMALRPELVHPRMSPSLPLVRLKGSRLVLQDGTLLSLQDTLGPWLTVSTTLDKVTSEGIWGNPGAATAQLGEAAVEAVSDFLAEIARELASIEVDLLLSKLPPEQL